MSVASLVALQGVQVLTGRVLFSAGGGVRLWACQHPLSVGVPSAAQRRELVLTPNEMSGSCSLLAFIISRCWHFCPPLVYNTSVAY